MLRYIPHGFANAKPRKDILEEMARDGFIITDRGFRAAVKKAVRRKPVATFSVIVTEPYSSG